jgi:proteasome lid subunit RPN8/RPN11
MTTIHISDPVLADIERHCFSEIRHELGGVLHGTLDEGAVRVAGALPALSATADQTSVTFTHEVWDEVHATLDTEHPGDRIVGWYHTHPGFGLFLSEYDQFIHQNFFSDPSMVALVVDPVAGELGWFAWRDNKIVQTRTSATTTAATGPPTTAPTQSASRATVRRAAPALLLGGLALAAGGYFLGAQTQQGNTPPAAAAQPQGLTDQLVDARRAVSRLQNESAELRAALADARASAEPSNEASDERSIKYVVRRGDTLSAIAVFLYHDATEFGRIVDANPGLDADHLAVGQEIVLPWPETDGE